MKKILFPFIILFILSGCGGGTGPSYTGVPAGIITPVPTDTPFSTPSVLPSTPASTPIPGQTVPPGNPTSTPPSSTTTPSSATSTPVPPGISTGSVKVVVTEKTENGLEQPSIGATVKVSRTDITGSAAGESVITDLAPGDYTVTAEKEGFKTFSTVVSITKNGEVITVPALLEPAGDNIYVDTLKGDNISGDGSWNKPYKTVQKAVDVASYGKTIIVRSGDYDETVTFNSDNHLTVRSAKASQPVIKKGVVFNASATLSYITVQNQSGSGISIANAGPVISNCKITSSSATNGGGIYMFNSNPLIENSTVTSCSATSGGAIYISSASPVIKNCTIGGADTLKNSATGNGGGIFISASSRPVIQNSVIHYNSAFNGGGIYNNSINVVTLDGTNTIKDNTAVNGGGIYCDSNSSGSVNMLISSVIKNNSATSSGGGIYCVNGTGSVTVSGSTVEGNTATSSGGGIYCASGTGATSINGSVIKDNIAGSTAQAGQGGGIYNADSAGSVIGSINSITTIIGNKALGPSGSVNNLGGGIYNSAGNPVIINNKIEQNEAFGGGGIYIALGNPSISLCNIQANTANNGGGIYLYRGVPVIGGAQGNFNNIIYNNAIANGGGIFIDPGLTAAVPSITYNNIYSNTGAGNGKDMYYNDASPYYNVTARYNYWNVATPDDTNAYNQSTVGGSVRLIISPFSTVKY